MLAYNLMVDGNDDDFNSDEYVQPDSPDALKFQDGAKLVVCRICQAHLLVTMYSKVRDCAQHEPWRIWFTMS
jgi:hypothetical protein